MLDPHQEIRLPWNPEYDKWHDFWFKSTPQFRFSLDQMNLLEQILTWPDTWAVVPESVAFRLSSLDYISVHEIQSPPPERIIYYLKGDSKKDELIRLFLLSLGEELREIPHMISWIR